MARPLANTASGARRRRLARVVAGVALVLGLLCQPGAVLASDKDADPLTEGRRQFMAAYDAADRPSADTAPRDSEVLKAYPLYPYLVAERLQQRTGDPAAASDIRSFLETHGNEPVARALRGQWLMALAVGRRWEDYLSVYRADIDDTVAGRCNMYAARVALDRTDGLADQVLADWNSPRSLPSACDPAFEWLGARGLLTPARVETRARAALAAGEPGLARYLAKSLPETTAAPLLQWAALIDKPRESVEALIASPDRTVEPAALLDGWSRYARSDPEAAADRYSALVAARGLDADTAGPYAIAVGMNLALAREPQALEFFALGRPVDFDERAYEWQTRAALWAGDWTRVRDSIAAMPEALRNQNRWRYWAARASHELGDEAAAKLGYSAVVPTDNWYAVLSAARLGQQFTPGLKPAGISDAAMGQLMVEPALVRAQELRLCEMEPRAIAEWRYAYDGLDRPAQVQAIGIAARWGWYLHAIAAAAKLGIFDDYELLYPRPYDYEVRRGAQLSGLPQDLIYAIIRQESLYRADARSSAGALGLMQLLLQTARHTAKTWEQPRPTRLSLLDPSVNVPLGSAYLRGLFDRWGEQAPLAIGSYNAGPGAVRRWLPEAPMAVDVWVENIPYNETRNYVQKVSWHTLVFGWLADRKPQNVAGWLGTVRPQADDTATDK